MQPQITTSLAPNINGGRIPKHGHRRRSGSTPEYQAWRRLSERCYSPHCKAFKNYGGRGITVCDHWRGEQGFQHFLADMGEKPTPKHVYSLDRTDNNKGYSPDNCRWATYREQARNTRTNRLITYDGKTLCLTEWAEHLGVRTATLARRLKAHPVEIAFNHPPRKCTTKLSSDVLCAIQERVANGERQATLAVEFGLHQSTVSRIVHQKRRAYSSLT